MGFTILLLSTRLSTEAYVNLLRLTNCQKLVVGHNFKNIVTEIQGVACMSSFDIVVKEEYDLKQPSGPRFPYVRPSNASQQLSFVSSPAAGPSTSNITTNHLKRSSTPQDPPGSQSQSSRPIPHASQTTPVGSPTGPS